MKNVQFRLAEEKYRLAKKRLQDSGLSWQKVCERLTDQIIFSESLDEFGEPLAEMAPSLRQKAQSALEGHMETALWKYIQLNHLPGSRDQKHWMAALQAALKLVVKANAAKNFKRGYLFSQTQLEEFLDSVWPDAVWLAAGHLGLDSSGIHVQKPTLDELFQFSKVPFSLF